MKTHSFPPSQYFDLANVSFADLFDGVDNIWEVFSRIPEYILKQQKRGSSITIGEETVIEEGTKILGPVIIGKNCIVSHTAFIRENCIIGDNVYIGHCVELKNAIVLNNTRIPHLSYVGDSILGNDVNLGGGAKTANFRLDKKNVSVKIGEERIETGLQKFGAIIGDNSSIGLNVVLNPGTIIGKESIIYPLVSVTGVHERNSVIR